MKLFELFATLSLDTKDFDKGVKGAAKQGESLGATLKNKVGAGTIAMGNLIAGAVQMVGNAAVQMGKKAWQGVAELEQNLGGSEAVWGEWADEIQATASHAFSAMGLSMSDYLAEANKMGSLLKGSGYTTAEAYQLTTDVMQRASDVASIMGIDVASAMQAIEGAAKGNFTMMDNLGVAINDTTLANYALEKGITKSTRSMTTQEKTALAFQLFMERTADYAGNYAKENDTLSGSFTTLSASFDNFLAGKGTVDEFVDAVENAARVGFKALGEMVPRLATSIGTALQKAWPKAKALLGEWAQIGFDKGAELIANIYNGITGGDVTPEEVKQIFSDIVAEVNRIAGNVVSFGKDAFQWIVDNKDFVLAAIGGIGAGFLTFKAIVNPVGAAISAIVAGLVLLVDNWEEVKAAIDNAIKSFREFIGLSEHDSPVAQGQTFGGQSAKDAVDAWTDSLLSGDAERQTEAWARVQGELGGSEMAASFSAAYQEYLAANDLDFGARVPAEWFEGAEADLQSGLDEMSLTAQPGAKWDSGARSTLQSALSSMSLTAPVSVRSYLNGSSLAEQAFAKISGAYGHATGLDYVPYNNYAARLHEGEAVLTKAEATAWRRGDGAASPAIDYDRLAGAIASAMAGTSVQMDGQAVGVLVAPTVSRQFGRQTLARKHTTR